MKLIEKIADELFFLFMIFIGLVITIDMISGIYQFYSPNKPREETQFERIERLHDELMQRIKTPINQEEKNETGSESQKER